jgi:hypothetical protein
MTRIPFFGAAVALSALFGSHASAQHMIDEPGMYAFYRPNGDLGIGSARSPIDAQAMAPRLVMRQPIARRMPSHKWRQSSRRDS